MPQKIILGNGLTAKIFAFYNREYKIIGEENSLTTEEGTAPLIFLQYNPYNIKFIQDLSETVGKQIPFTIKNFDILCSDKGEYIRDMTKEDKLKIISKKLTETGGKKLNFIHPLFQSIAMSEESHGILKIIDINFKDVIKLLNEVISSQIICKERIKSIVTDFKIIYTDTKAFEYDSCVSTISIDKLYILCGVESHGFDTLDTTVVKGTEHELGINLIPYENAIIYFPQENIEFSKVIKRDGICYAEITGDSLVFKNGIKSHATRIVKKSLPFVFPGIVFLGRYAEWNPDIRIQDIIRRSSEKTIMQEIWNDQKAFSSRYFNYEPNIDILQRNIKECVLLLQRESFDLLECINWKVHSNNKIKLDYEKIKEEWIDIYKYWLTIGINLGINYEEFVDAYNKKSKRLNENGKSQINKLDI